MKSERKSQRRLKCDYHWSYGKQQFSSTHMNTNGYELNLSWTSAPMSVCCACSIYLHFDSIHIIFISFIQLFNIYHFIYYSYKQSILLSSLIAYNDNNNFIHIPASQPHICRSHQNITKGIICTWQSITPFTF